MKTISFSSLFALLIILIIACQKPEYELSNYAYPSNLSFTPQVAGATTAKPAGDGTGVVTLSVTGNNVLSYSVNFGDESTSLFPVGATITHKYTKIGTFEYVIVVTAIGPGGTVSSISKSVTVTYNYALPATIMTNLTGNASKVWVSDKNANGHFGVGNKDTFTPDYYAAPPNARDACAYDDEVTFTKASATSISMQVNNGGASFIIKASKDFYGQAEGEKCVTLDTGGVKTLSFGDATSASTSSNSTRVQFTVPGNGILIFGTGGVTYEILELSDTKMTLRNIGADGNAWYQKLIVKP